MCNKCKCAGAGLAAFLLGAVVGAAAGVLFAPAKGEVTRRKLKRWADDTYEDKKEYVLEHAGELKENLKERAGEVREKLAEQAGVVRETLADPAGVVREIVEDGKNKLIKEFNRRKEELADKFKKD